MANRQRKTFGENSQCGVASRACTSGPTERKSQRPWVLFTGYRSVATMIDQNELGPQRTAMGKPQASMISTISRKLAANRNERKMVFSTNHIRVRVRSFPRNGSPNGGGFSQHARTNATCRQGILAKSAFASPFRVPRCEVHWPLRNLDGPAI
jgi:hypothetical protein